MPSPGSSRFLSTETLVDNKWHRYCRDRFRQGDGSVGEYYHIAMPGACGIIPVFADGSTVLLRVYRYLHDTTLWEFPIGGMSPGDDRLDVAKKELGEEAGLIAKTWRELGRFIPYRGASTEVDSFYLATDLTETAQNLEPSEEITVHRMPFEEARARLVEQPLIDGQSLVGLHLYDRFGTGPELWDDSPRP